MESSSTFATYPSLRNRVVVVTGGASGIGAAIVEAFAMQQATVAFLDIQDSAAAQLIERLQIAGGAAATYVHCDLTDIDELQSAIAGILERFDTVDVLVNNAGNDTRHSIAEVTSSYWDQCMAINLKAQFFMAQGLIPSMKRAGRGSIVNLSSIVWAIPSTNAAVYVTAKAGVVGLTRTLAHELGGDNIRVNCVMPGAVWTERQKRLWLTEAYMAEIMSGQAIKRMIEPGEVARLVLFLAADDSAAITNQSLVIDAGWI